MRYIVVVPVSVLVLTSARISIQYCCKILVQTERDRQQKERGVGNKERAKESTQQMANKIRPKGKREMINKRFSELIKRNIPHAFLCHFSQYLHGWQLEEEPEGEAEGAWQPLYGIPNIISISIAPVV